MLNTYLKFTEKIRYSSENHNLTSISIIKYLENVGKISIHNHEKFMIKYRDLYTIIYFLYIDHRDSKLNTINSLPEQYFYPPKRITCSLTNFLENKVFMAT